MVSITYLPAEEFIKQLAEHLANEKIIQAPDWSMYVKTAHSRENRPSQDDWYYIRAASLLRKIAIRGPIGVSRLRKPYGGKTNRGSKPDRFGLASGSIIRRILQQLEKANLLEKAKDSKGRKVTPKGQSFLDKFANEMIKDFPDLARYQK